MSKEQFDKILDMCKKGEEQGATLETGGKRHGDKGYYIEPTVFSNVQDDNIIATDEIFGPVQSIMKWSTIEEVRALQHACIAAEILSSFKFGCVLCCCALHCACCEVRHD